MSLKKAFQKELEKNAKDLLLDEVDTDSASKIADMTTAEYIAFLTLRRMAKKPNTSDAVNVSKIIGELNEGTSVNIGSLDEALKDCKQ